MGYRDELGAAQARADAASRQLEAEKEARGGDAARIAELERSLAASLEELATLREGAEPEDSKAEPKVKPAKSQVQGVFVVSIIALFFIAGVAGYMMIGISADVDTGGGGYEVFAPAEPEFDVSEQLEVARRAATRHFSGEFLSGPYLRKVEARAVDDNGLNHLEFGYVWYEFVVELKPLSPRQDDRPVGTRAAQVDDRNCSVMIKVNERGIQYPSQFTADINRITGLSASCKTESIGPRCTLSEIRKRSLADGAPEGAMAVVSLGSSGNWYVGIVDQGQELFSRNYPDDCVP